MVRLHISRIRLLCQLAGPQRVVVGQVVVEQRAEVHEQRAAEIAKRRADFNATNN